MYASRASERLRGAPRLLHGSVRFEAKQRYPCQHPHQRLLQHLCQQEPQSGLFCVMESKTCVHDRGQGSGMGLTASVQPLLRHWVLDTLDCFSPCWQQLLAPVLLLFKKVQLLVLTCGCSKGFNVW
jgi:hypothetical protein